MITLTAKAADVVRDDIHKGQLPAHTALRLGVVNDGGKDSGTHSATCHAEKDYTLDWANRLADALAAQGWQVFLTRTNDGD